MFEKVVRWKSEDVRDVRENEEHVGLPERAECVCVSWFGICLSQFKQFLYCNSANTFILQSVTMKTASVSSSFNLHSILSDLVKLSRNSVAIVA